MSKGTFWLGAVIGGAAAYTAAMLFAPKSGDELQEDLKEQAYRAKEAGQDYIEIAKNNSGDVKAVLQDASKGVSSSFKEATTKISEQARVDGPILKDNLKGLTKRDSMSKELLKANLKASGHDLKTTASALKEDLSETGKTVKIVSSEAVQRAKEDLAATKAEREEEREFELYHEAFQEELNLENTFKE